MDLDRLDLNLLRVLDVLLQEQHVSRAAVRLHLTQPAVSGALARLRAVFADPLLVRGAGGLAPTPHAVALAPRVRALIAQAGDLLAPAARFEPSTAKRRFAIATTDDVLALLHKRLLGWAVASPGIDVAFLHADPSARLPQLERGEIDLLVTNRARISGRLHLRSVLSEEFVVIGRRRHPALMRPLTLERFCALDQLLVSPSGGEFTGIADAALARIGRARRVRLSVPGFHAAIDLVAASDLIAVFPAGLARRHADRLRVVAAPFAIPGFAIATVWHPRLHHDPAHRWLRNEVAAGLSENAAA